jgi:hypothetical protein
VTKRSVIRAESSSRKKINVNKLFEKKTNHTQTKKLTVVTVKSKIVEDE